ncbi:MAG TPA: kynureninase [Ferruginibacter sp.]|nr:kynureninase [Ferruginibacter sp.]HRO06425.1 kynureninase [Ferruginibacter sp.]HRO96487.1 kynureninase [Ferruginibacter sp.]HRP50100.1 kynureninase [Ferruginibacter sp.]
MNYTNTLEYAKMMDEKDPLKSYRSKFYIPIVHGKESIYLTGNSLGLQPKTTQDAVMDELEDWANYGVEGHMHARNPWYSYHEIFPELLTDIVGAKAEEIVVMNQLTVNLQLLLTTFYRPKGKRNKIICEAKAFPSDQYALASHVQIHGLNPDECIIEVHPREGSQIIEHDDIISTIQQYGDETALVLFGGVNYYTGQVFNMKEIVRVSNTVGAYCGFDLAHAAGNIELELHDWQVDFACWCTYKYLNSGPGSVGGVFIHEKHITNTALPRLAGWWGHNKERRFKMEKTFDPIPTAEGWQLSNAPVLSMAAHKAALEVFRDARFTDLVEKSKLLTGYLFYVLKDINHQFNEPVMDILTPENAHGCQVSIVMKKDGKRVFDRLIKESVIADWREPDVIRVAPVPLYNTFEDVYRFGTIILQTLEDSNK